MAEGYDGRKVILQAAEGLIIRQGYHGLSMREIAEAVGVSKAALYYYFKDKEELFLALLDNCLDENEKLLEQAQVQAHDCRGRIKIFVRGILSQPPGQRALIRLASQEMGLLSPPARQALYARYHSKFIDRLRAILQEGIESGELRPFDSSMMAWALLGMLYPYFYPAHSRDAPPPESVLDGLLEIYFQGVSQR